MADRSFVPDGWPVVTPRIVSDRPEALVSFIKHVFEAEGGYNATRPSELWIGGSVIMISDPEARPVTPAFLYVYVADADATFARAIEAGATSLEAPQDMP